MTLSILLPIIGIAYISLMTWLSYKLGTTKTDNAKTAAITGFFLSFIPPFVLIYLVILLLKEDTDIV